MTALDGSTIMAPVRAALARNDTYAKGQALERAVKSLLRSVPGIIDISQRVVDAFASEEIDLVVYNEHLPGGLPFPSGVFLVECKNWSTPVGADHIRLFGAKLRERGLSLGVLVAANGITSGRDQRSAGNAAIADHLMAGVQILVITVDQLECLHSTEELCALMIQRLMELVGTRGQLPLGA